MMPNILITGGNGFVGQCLLSALIKKGAFVRAIVRNNNNKMNASEIIVQNVSAQANWQNALKDINVVILGR
jgi:uncharacterized protein YbjT (DUF2867 family)